MTEKISMTIEDLQSLLYEQKKLVVDELLSGTYLYNTESTSGRYEDIKNIDKKLFTEKGMSAKFPSDLYVLKKYLI